MSEIILIRGVEAMCSSCGHVIVYYSRWSHSWSSIASDACLCPVAEEKTMNDLLSEKCYCNEAVPEPDTENYHHCSIGDLEKAGFKNAIEIVSITDVNELLDSVRLTKIPLWIRMEYVAEQAKKFTHWICLNCGQKHTYDFDICTHCKNDRATNEKMAESLKLELKSVYG